MILHEKVSNEHLERITMKKKVGEKLLGLEAIEKGSNEFWQLSLADKERFLELSDPDF